MPVNNFTVGRDVSIVINGPNGQITLNGITEFTAKPVVNTLKSKPLNGLPQFGYVPDGWELSFKLDRMDRGADDFYALFEAGYYNGQNQAAGTVNESIQEVDGSISQWRYTGFVMKLDNPGDFSGDKKVEQSLSGLASQRIRVA
jgi:hypothetical protein